MVDTTLNLGRARREDARGAAARSGPPMAGEPPTGTRGGWLRAPALHFAALGALLFVAQPAIFPPGPAQPLSVERPPIVISGTQIEQLRAEFARQTGTQPGPVDEQALIDQAIEDEIVYQEALVRGLDRGDRSIRFRMIQKMHFLNGEVGTEGDPESDQALYEEARALGLDHDDVVIRRILSQKMRLLAGQWAVAKPPTEEELQQYFDAHVDDYRQPARASLTHVFLSRAQRPDTLLDDANQLLAALRADATTPETAVGRGDVFPLGHRFRSKSQHDLEKLFGSDFAAAVISGRAGAWLGPIRSPYGLHLVWIASLAPERVPDLAEVRKQVEQSVRTEQREKGFEELLDELRGMYDIRVEREDAASRGTTSS